MIAYLADPHESRHSRLPYLSLIRKLRLGMVQWSQGGRIPAECPLTGQIGRIAEEIDNVKMECWRHPEPSMLRDLEVTDPTLQIRGVWKKVRTQGSEKPKSRNAFYGWVWKGGLYIIGGEHDSFDLLEDAW